MAEYSLDEVMQQNGKKTYTLDEVVPKAKSNVVGSGIVDSMMQVPRQLGLATRYGAEGLADTAGIFSDPLAVASNRLLGTKFSTARDATANLLDSVGLPKPETAQERVVGDASRLLAGTGGFMKAGSLIADGTTGALSAGMRNLASNPGMQAASSLGGGYAGGTARENGEGAIGQLGATVAGGLAAPLLAQPLISGVQSIANSVKNILNPDDVNLKVENVIRQAQLDPSLVPSGVMTDIKSRVKSAIQNNQPLSPDAVRRLADYQSVGAKPLRSNLTLDPFDVTREKNLAKLAVNSAGGSEIATIQNSNNKSLIDGLNSLGANTSDDMYSAGNKIISTLGDRDARVKNVIGSLYQNARDTNGRSALLDPSYFTNTASNMLDDALLGSKLPADVRNLLNKTAQGEMPLTVDVAEQLKTRIGDLQRASIDGSERKALGMVRQALETTPLLEAEGKQAQDAFKIARKANFKYMQMVDKTPALQAVRDGIEPDKFVQQFIIGNGKNSNVMDVAMLKSNIKSSPEAMNAVKGQILSHLKSNALSGNADEVGKFSPAGFNRAFNAIGERKLGLFFKPEEIEQLKRIGRVSSYENFQPVGSAVNNSNTAGALFNHGVDFLGKYVPFGKMLSEPINNIQLTIGQRNALNANKAIIANQPKQPQRFVPLLPLAASQGLLTSEQ